MKTVMKSAFAGAALLGVVMTGGASADGTSPAFPFAATASIAGGYSWLEPELGPFIRCIGDCERELALVVGGGDFVIPVTGFWNIQLGGTWYTEHEHEFFGSFSNTQFQGGGIGFWRDPMTGAFGIEAGLFSVNGDNRPRPDSNYVKLGGLGEYYWGDMATVSVFGGVLLPFDESPFGVQGPQIDTGFYTGGHLTWYTSSNLALAAFGRYVQTNFSFGPDEVDVNNLVVGGKIRYLTSMPGIELFASGAYRSCWDDESFGGFTRSFVEDGVEVLAGVNIRLGGRDGSLVDIDRSNAVDTRAWTCASRGLS
jgi:hypothetical protein